MGELGFVFFLFFLVGDIAGAVSPVPADEAISCPGSDVVADRFRFSFPLTDAGAGEAAAPVAGLSAPFGTLSAVCFFFFFFLALSAGIDVAGTAATELELLDEALAIGTVSTGRLSAAGTGLPACCSFVASFSCFSRFFSAFLNCLAPSTESSPPWASIAFPFPLSRAVISPAPA